MQIRKVREFLFFLVIKLFQGFFVQQKRTQLVFLFCKAEGRAGWHLETTCFFNIARNSMPETMGNPGFPHLWILGNKWVLGLGKRSGAAGGAGWKVYILSCFSEVESLKRLCNSLPYCSVRSVVRIL